MGTQHHERMNGQQLICLHCNQTYTDHASYEQDLQQHLYHKAWFFWVFRMGNEDPWDPLNYLERPEKRFLEIKKEMSKKFVALKAKTEKVGSEKLIYKDLKEFFELNRKIKDRPSQNRKRKPSSGMKTERAKDINANIERPKQPKKMENKNKNPDIKTAISPTAVKPIVLPKLPSAMNQPKIAQTPSTSNLPDVFLEFDLEEDLKALESEAIVND